MTNKTIEAIIGDTACSVSPVRLGACWAPAIRPEAPQHGIISKTRHFYLAETRHLNLGLTFNVEALLKCPGLDFLEMSGFEVQKSLC